MRLEIHVSFLPCIIVLIMILMKNIVETRLQHDYVGKLMFIKIHFSKGTYKGRVVGMVALNGI